MGLVLLKIVLPHWRCMLIDFRLIFLGTSYTHTMLTEPHLVDMKCIIMGSTMCVCACVEKVQSDGNKTPGTVWTTNLRISDYVNGSHLSAGTDNDSLFFMLYIVVSFCQ